MSHLVHNIASKLPYKMLILLWILLALEISVVYLTFPPFKNPDLLVYIIRTKPKHILGAKLLQSFEFIFIIIIFSWSERNERIK